MTEAALFFQQVLKDAFLHYFKEREELVIRNEKPIPDYSFSTARLFPDDIEPSFEEQTVLLLALMPHVSPETLDLFFLQNKDLDRPYTEFGGWKGVLHSGFLPTGQTALFLIAQLSTIYKEATLTGEEALSFIVHLFSKDHWFYQHNILRLEGQGEGEPFLSGRLAVSEEFLAKVLPNGKYEPEYNSNFPAKRIHTALEWNDLVLPYNLLEELNDISRWLQHQQAIRERWRLDRIIKPGYRCLFYGPPGTGKTLTATLLGKQNKMDVYRVDLSMIVSKYIGETEKNLAKVFDKAERQHWILFFDEADALFGQRTETQSSNDRHANQEVAYLLQRIEDFPGMVILATNLKENIDEAFFRRFQSALYFPIPDENMRRELWKKTLPEEWLTEDSGSLLQKASKYELSGGSIINIIQTCAIRLYGTSGSILTQEILEQAIAKERIKDGTILRNVE